MRFDGEHLPYIDNLVNLIVVDPSIEVPDAELLRVLAPYGVATAKGKRMVKPYPKEMDEWPQYLHGADNNCVAKDTVVGPPRHVQWISGPAWTRSHMGAAVHHQYGFVPRPPVYHRGHGHRRESSSACRMETGRPKRF